ncbi:MAG: nitroreductase family deazaflavin-dependent oxidoreductase [Chloroflexi bacterium]|nr:nitroreductase family deazaflavin-dependent oxidoreductase [Chloroflexota bacterium]
MADNAFMRFGNSMTAALLRSPLHGMLSGSTMLVTVTGRKSGQPITTPVSYVRIGNALSITSLRTRQWWRNARGGAPVSVVLRGAAVRGTATVIEDERAVADALAAQLRAAPQTAKWYGVALDAAGNPDFIVLDRIAKTRVVVRITVNG